MIQKEKEREAHNLRIDSSVDIVVMLLKRFTRGILVGLSDGDELRDRGLLCGRGD